MAEPTPITQNPDIRLLGRILGDVIRDLGGDDLFRRTEAIRAASVTRQREGLGVETLAGELGALSLDDTLAFLRGFMLFSMLANLAACRRFSICSATRVVVSRGPSRDSVVRSVSRTISTSPTFTNWPSRTRISVTRPTTGATTLSSPPCGARIPGTRALRAYEPRTPYATREAANKAAMNTMVHAGGELVALNPPIHDATRLSRTSGRNSKSSPRKLLSCTTGGRYTG